VVETSRHVLAGVNGGVVGKFNRLELAPHRAARVGVLYAEHDP